MGLVHLDDHTLDNEKEDDKLVAKTSELNADKISKKPPLILDAKLPSWNNLSVPFYIKFLNVSKDLRHCDMGILEHEESKCLGVSNSRPSEVFIERLSRHCRRTKSANDLGDIFVEYASSPLPRYIMARSFIKSSLFLKLGTPDAAIRPSSKATSFSFVPMNNSSPSGSSPLSLVPSFNSSSPRSETSSCQSNAPRLNVCKGIIYCVRRNGSLNLLFKEDTDNGKVYMTNVHKIESCVDQAIDYLYTFRSMTGNVGKMKVFSSLILNPDRSRSVETEFVLFGAEESPKVAQNSIYSAIKNKGLAKKVANMFRSNNSEKMSDSDESKLLQPSVELAAIVVKSLLKRKENELETGGWGLKFLKRVHADTSHKEDIMASCTRINVVIPAGHHGCPMTGDGGPSTLTERWRSGGRCDCGGWDVGCPFTVLHDEGDFQEDCKTVDLFIEGSRHAEPAIKMVTTSEGVLTVYFRPTLSALQAFSVGVAIIHSRTRELHPKL